MKTIFITGNDTQIGKTYVASFLARFFVERKKSVQYVKIVETGLSDKQPKDGSTVAKTIPRDLTQLFEQKTLFRFIAPLAPSSAGQKEGQMLFLQTLLKSYHSLDSSKIDWRIIEGAGGLASPIENSNPPKDWRDFAHAIQPDYTLIVVENRLGSIHQSRVLSAYISAKPLGAVGFWLSEPKESISNDQKNSNLEFFKKDVIPLWGLHSYNNPLPEFHTAPWVL